MSCSCAILRIQRSLLMDIPVVLVAGAATRSLLFRGEATYYRKCEPHSYGFAASLLCKSDFCCVDVAFCRGSCARQTSAARPAAHFPPSPTRSHPLFMMK